MSSDYFKTQFAIDHDLLPRPSRLRPFLRHMLGRGAAPPASATRARFLFLNYEIPLGYAVLATTTFAAIKSARPDAYIAVAASGISANLLRASAHVDEVIVTPHPATQIAQASRYVLQRIWPRRRDFDYVVTDAANARPRVALLAVLSGVRYRVGVTLKPELFHSPLLYDYGLSHIANNLRLLSALGMPDTPVEPAINFTSADLAAVQALLASGPPSTGPRIAVCVNSSAGHPNEWFDERWSELLSRLARRLDAQIVLTGTAEDVERMRRLQEAIGVPTLSVAGRTDLPQLAALMALGDLVVTIDTGGLHVARAVNAPTVVLANAAQPDHWWLPSKTDPRFRILRHAEVPCALCLKFACATRECMQESSVDMVEQAVIAHLSAFAPSAEARAARVAARVNDGPPILSRG